MKLWWLLQWFSLLLSWSTMCCSVHTPLLSQPIEGSLAVVTSRKWIDYCSGRAGHLSTGATFLVINDTFTKHDVVLKTFIPYYPALLKTLYIPHYPLHYIMEKVNFALNNQLSESYLDSMYNTVKPDSMTCGLCIILGTSIRSQTIINWNQNYLSLWVLDTTMYCIS